MKNAIMNGVNIISYAYIYIGGRDGGVKLFPGGGGPNANFFRNPCTYLLFSRVGCPDPLSPSGSVHEKRHHNRTIFTTVPLLNIIVRH